MIPNQEEEMAKLPPGVREQVEKFVKDNPESVAGIKVVGIPRIALDGESEDDGDGFKGMKPLRSVKLTPKLVALAKEIQDFAKKGAAEIKKMRERHDELQSRGRELKSKVWAHVAVETGFNLSRFEMNINHDTNELEIMTDNRPNEPWPKYAAVNKLKGKKK